MAGAEAGAVVAVEVFVEIDQIAPVRVFLELPRAAVDRTPAPLTPTPPLKGRGEKIAAPPR